jgi:hypothetical protein
MYSRTPVQRQRLLNDYEKSQQRHLLELKTVKFREN